MKRIALGTLIFLCFFSCVSKIDEDIAFFSEKPVPIMSKTKLPKKVFIDYILNVNKEIPADKCGLIYDAYLEICNIEGVSLIVALAQMIHETNFQKYGGTVIPEQNNFAGLGTVSTKERGLFFPDLKTGITAHVQHLKAYGSTNSLVTDLVDPRFKYVKRGSAETVDELTGRWAQDPDYGKKLRSHIIRLLKAQK